VIVIFQVVERPTNQYIKIVGCEHSLVSSLKSKTDLKEKDGLDPYAIKEARDNSKPTTTKVATTACA